MVVAAHSDQVFSAVHLVDGGGFWEMDESFDVADVNVEVIAADQAGEWPAGFFVAAPGIFVDHAED